MNQYVEVDREHLYRAEIAQVMAGRGVHLTAAGDEINDAPGVLALSQSDPSTVLVVVDGLPVGTLPATPGYLAAVRAANLRQEDVAATARIWALDDNGATRARVTLKVADPDQITPPAPIPSSVALLPRGNALQVTGEEGHLDALTAYLAGRSEAPALATLHALEPIGRSTKRRVQVQIGGHEVGTLTPQSSVHFLALIDAANEEGITLGVRAEVRGNNIKADVTIYAAKAGQLSNEWLNEHIYGAARTEQGDLRGFYDAMDAAGEESQDGSDEPA